MMLAEVLRDTKSTDQLSASTFTPSSATLSPMSSTDVESKASASPSSSCPPPCSPPRRSLAQKLDHALLNLSPSFFSINMGTGITSILLHGLPYNARWLQYIADVIFVLNTAVFVLLAGASIIRYIRWKGLFTALNKHVAAGMFWGCLPMGFATVVNMIALVCVPAWGYRWAQLALGLWWVDAIVSILVNLGMVFMFFTRQTHTSETVSAVFLLPIVASVVAAASGGVVASALMPFNPTLAHSTVIVSYVIWGTGVPLAMFIITLWIYRTIISGVPAPGAMCSVFLPLGPCGQGSFGIMLLGRTIRDLAYNHNVGFAIVPSGASSAAATASIQAMADAVYAGGLITGMVLWGLGLCWYILAFAMVLDHVRTNRDFFFHAKFSVALWAITFPIGVFATATTTLAEELDSPAFRVIGTFLSLQVTLHWIYVGLMTLYKSFDCTIFVAPELAAFQNKRPPLRWASSSHDVEKAPASSA